MLKDDVINLKTSSNILEPSAEERAKFRARAVEGVTRGQTIDVLNVSNQIKARNEGQSDGYHYEWIHNDSMSIAEMESELNGGFTFVNRADIQGTPQEKIAGQADGSVKHIDMILMRAPKWKIDIITQERTAHIQNQHLKGRTSVDAKAAQTESSKAAAGFSEIGNVAGESNLDPTTGRPYFSVNETKANTTEKVPLGELISS